MSVTIKREGSTSSLKQPSTVSIQSLDNVPTTATGKYSPKFFLYRTNSWYYEVFNFSAMNDYETVDEKVIFKENEKTKTIVVRIFDDTDQPVMEGEESFNLQLSMPENAKLKDPNKTIIVINDKDLDG